MQYVAFTIRDIERALAKDRLKPWTGVGKVYADTGLARTNAHFISDSIVFWSNTLSAEDVWDCFLTAAYFNTYMNFGNLPVRGSVHIGELDVAQTHSILSEQSSFTMASPYGKGMVEAYSIAENQNWFATLVTSELVECLKRDPEVTAKLENYLFKCPFPDKANRFEREAFLMRYRFPECGYGGSYEHEEKLISTSFNQLVDDGNPRSEQKRKNTLELLLKQSK